jgi:hypothetical protein
MAESVTGRESRVDMAIIEVIFIFLKFEGKDWMRIIEEASR